MLLLWLHLPCPFGTVSTHQWSCMVCFVDNHAVTLSSSQSRGQWAWRRSTKSTLAQEVGGAGIRSNWELSSSILVLGVYCGLSAVPLCVSVYVCPCVQRTRLWHCEWSTRMESCYLHLLVKQGRRGQSGWSHWKRYFPRQSSTIEYLHALPRTGNWRPNSGT